MFRTHYFVKCRSIFVSWPDLKAVLGVGVFPEWSAIFYKWLNSRSGGLGTSGYELCVNCIEHDLKSGKSLLSINNGALLQISNGILQLLENNSAKKVRLLRNVGIG
jgi:hypothetical protein